MKQNIARDLLLLAAVAFRNNKFDNAGAMFAAAMSSEDADELISQLDVEGILKSDEASSIDNAEVNDAPRVGLAAIARSLSDAMSYVSESSDEDEDEDDVDLPPIEDGIEEDEDEADSDDLDSEVPGRFIIPSSLSSGNQGGGHAVKVLLPAGVRTPIRVK